MLAFFAGVIFTSCSKKSNELGKTIPANASFVLHINGKSVFEKLPWAEIRQNQLFTTVYKDTSLSSFMKAAMDNPENTGIDINNDFVIFMTQDSTGGYMAIQGSVKDASKFKAFNAEANKGDVMSEKEGVNYSSSDGRLSTWNKDKFLILVDAGRTRPGATMQFDSLGRPDTNYVPAPVRPVRNLNTDAAALYALGKDASLANEERFTDLIGGKADMHLWVNSEAVMNSGAMGPMPMSMINLNKLYDGSRMAAKINFENGKIVFDAKSYSNKEMAAIWKKYSGGKISENMASRVTSKNIAAYFNFHFPPEGLKEFIKVLGLDGLINMGAGQTGFSFDEFIKANKGDIQLTVSDIRKDTSGKTSANVVFATSIGDKASFNKIVDAGKKFGGQFPGEMANGIFYNMNAEYFAIGNDKPSIDAFIAGSTNTKPAFFEQVSGNPMGAYVNFQYIMNAMKADITTQDSLSAVMLNESIKTWDYLIATGGNYEDGAANSHMEIFLVDKNNNSLKQLNAYLSIMGAAAEKKRSTASGTWDREWNQADTTTVTVE